MGVLGRVRLVEHRIILPFVLQAVSSECRLGTAKDNPSASVMLLPFYIAELSTLTDHSENKSLLFSVKDDFPLHVALEY